MRDGGEDDEGEDGPEDMDAFRRGVHVAAVRRFEKNRRPGGRKIQDAMVCGWNEFAEKALASKEILDNKVDEHSLLLFIKFPAERPKRNRRGVDIPGTFIGASQLKKLFFGALRIRKEQDAADPSLARRRPATSMDEALERERNGLTPEEDATDMRANTWLSQVTEQQLKQIGYGFLSHRQLRLAVWGHLAWTAQHASGNRGDDFRALKLAELQPTVLKHPDKRTDIYAVLGMQGEEKAGRRGMRTVINPVYSVFVANIKPEMCPLGAFAFYFHYHYDEKKIIETMNLDYTVNKSWCGIRVLHGPKSPTTPFNEQNLHTFLAIFSATIGVDPLETSKLGWAILGAAGYRADEVYDPIWRKVRVPPPFLSLVFPMAEEIQQKVAGNPHLSGAFHHWEMVVELRDYLFQCGAAIWQLVPDSLIFQLPAFQDRDVRNWMTTEYPTQLSTLQAAAGDPLEIERVQNVVLARALTSLNRTLSDTRNELRELRELLTHRTAVFTPARGFSAGMYTRNALSDVLDHDVPIPSPGSIILPRNEVSATVPSPNSNLPSISASESPRSSGTASAPRLVAQVQLVLPPLAAFYPKGSPLGVIHPIMGMQSARWVEDVFPAIKRPEMCWDVWGPGSGLEQFSDIEAMWKIYAVGARISVDGDSGETDGGETHMKPPLKLVENFFRHEWRTSAITQVGTPTLPICFPLILVR
ncbi:hypothetical protein C8R45DRAFT_1136097 [Mycena sanguinolenta]|nr:hypothetical protein C8R45DRAFT_1136097 [Mycena sanguinolenta]